MIRVICKAGVTSAEDLPPRPHTDSIALDNHWWITAAFTTRVHMVVVYDTTQVCFGPLTLLLCATRLPNPPQLASL